MRPQHVSPLDQPCRCASIYCCLPKQSSLLSGFEDLLILCQLSAAFGRGSAATLLSRPIKVSVINPDFPVTSASQVHHVLSACRSISSALRAWLMLCAPFRLRRDVALSQNCRMRSVLCVGPCKDRLWLILATVQICGEKILVMIAIVGVEPWLPAALKWCVEGAVFLC